MKRYNNPLMLKMNRLRKIERDEYNRAIAKGNEIRLEEAEQDYLEMLSLEDERVKKRIPASDHSIKSP